MSGSLTRSPSTSRTPSREASKQGFVANRLVFEGDLACPVVKRHHSRPESVGRLVRYANERPFGDVVVDDEVQGQTTGSGREAGNRKVLDPDARVEKLRLMAGNDDRAGGLRDCRQVDPTRFVVSPGDLNGVSAGLGEENVIAASLEVMIPGAEPRHVGFNCGESVDQRRFGEDVSVTFRGAEAVGEHQQHPPATARPERSIALRKTAL